MYRLTVGRIVQGEGVFVGVDLDFGDAPHNHIRAACRAVIEKSRTDGALYTLDLHIFPNCEFAAAGDCRKARIVRRYTVQNGISTICEESRRDSLKAMRLYYTVGASD